MGYVTYTAGQPCWFELTPPDPAAAQEFYRAMFGWQFVSSSGTHDVAMLGGKAAAAIGAGRPLVSRPSWLVYLATDDVAATVQAAEAAGGRVVRQPHDGPAGRSAVLADPTGGYVGLWQAAEFAGCEVIDEPGAFCWTEASSRDPARSAAFFADLFGLEVKRPFPGYSYAQLRVGGRQVAGVLGMTHERRPYTGPAAWLVYFQVGDTDGAVDTALAGGGELIEPAEDTGFGRLAILADPFGARFALITRT